MNTGRKLNEDLEATRIPLHDVPVALVVERITREKIAVSGETSKSPIPGFICLPSEQCIVPYRRTVNAENCRLLCELTQVNCAPPGLRRGAGRNLPRWAAP